MGPDRTARKASNLKLRSVEPRAIDSGLTEVERAQRLAVFMHAGQLYGPGVLHSQHCGDVVEVLKEFGFTDQGLLAAGWLHDIVEDTAMTLNILLEEYEFSRRIVGLVDAVTDSPGENRRERQRGTLPRTAENRDAIALKLADRIANVRAALAKRDRRFGMYRDEYPNFQKFLRKSAYFEHVPMWAELDRLLVPILNLSEAE